MIVIVAALKGGVGKTTTAIYLAAIAAKENRKRRVTVVDADPQASAADWLDAAEDSRLRDVELVEAPTERLLSKELKRIDDDQVMIVDTPPGNEQLLSRALSAADVAVVPTRVGGVEAIRVDAVRELVPSKVPSGLVVCAAREHTFDYQDAIDEWRKAKVPIWGTVPERVTIAAGPETRLLSWEGLRAYREVWDRARRVANAA